MCLNLNVGDVPLLTNIRTTLIDPDTPDSAHKITSDEGKEWELVVGNPRSSRSYMLLLTSC